MPKTNYAITFARMRTDVQRLITLAHTNELKAGFKVLLNVFDKLEHKLEEQPAVPTQSKPRKLTEAEERERESFFEAGRQARLYHNADINANPHEADTDAHKLWRKGWMLEHEKANANG